jgi:DNA repair exonuclease SbcCD ATPase subunit
MVAKCKDDKYSNDHYNDCNTAITKCEHSPSNDACESAKRNVENTRATYNKSCGDAGMGSTTCKTKMKTCSDVGESEDFATDNNLLVAFSEALGVPQNQVGSSCPKYSGQGFFERKDKYESELKDINKDLKDNKKEIADLNKDFTADMKKIQEDIADAQKEYQELQTKTKEDQRNRATENAKIAADLAKNTRALETLMMNKSQEINTIYTERNNSLVQITEAAANRTCMAQVREERKKYDAIASGSIRSQFQAASIKKKQLNDLFQECMVKFDQGRMKIIFQADQKIEALEKDIRNAQSDRDAITTQLSQMNSTEAQAKQDEETTLTNAQAALQQKIQRATTELQSLQTTTQTKNKATLEEQDYLTKRSKGVSNSIAALGAVPSDESSTTKISQVSGAYEDYRAAHYGALKSCKNDEYTPDQIFASEGKRKSAKSGKIGGKE